MRKDDFTKKTKDTLARRVAFRCSNPECRMATSGPNEEPTKSTNIGVAAHLFAASKNGPRYDPNQTSDERKAIENGIWLCDTCSVLIDRDPGKYPIERLLEWKGIAEKQAGAELNKQLAAGVYPDFSVGDGSEFEPVNENAYYEKEFAGGIVRYYLRDNLMHVEHELEPEIIAYYVLDNDGNLVDQKFPYPLEEYTVDIDPKMILRESETIQDDGFRRIEYDLKWGQSAVTIYHPDGKLAFIQFLKGGSVSHKEKRLYIEAPEFS